MGLLGEVSCRYFPGKADRWEFKKGIFYQFAYVIYRFTIIRDYEAKSVESRRRQTSCVGCGTPGDVVVVSGFGKVRDV